MSPGSDPGDTRFLEGALGETPICLRRPIWPYKNLIAETNRMLALHGLPARPFPAEDMTLYQAPWSKWDGAAFESSGARALKIGRSFVAAQWDFSHSSWANSAQWDFSHSSWANSAHGRYESFAQFCLPPPYMYPKCLWDRTPETLVSDEVLSETQILSSFPQKCLQDRTPDTFVFPMKS